MRFVKEERGQVVVVVAGGTLILLLLMGLAIDSGMAYIMKAKLSKAVDAAALTGMKNLWQGQATARTLATHIFNANFGPNPPVPTITFPVDANGNQQVSVSATTTVPTFFAQRFLQLWHVSNTAVATRGTLIMALILDRSGSMSSNGGGAALKNAVPNFVNYFNNTVDHVAMVSYASHASVDFPIATNFQTPITNAVNAMTFTGGTFGTGGTYVKTSGPPLTLADNQISSVPVVSGSNTVRVVVYFTDGLMNTVQDQFTCYTSATKTITPYINFGGFDSGTQVDSLDPTSETILGGPANTLYYASGMVCQNPWGTNVSKFFSQATGTQVAINQTNVTTDSQFRAIQTATAMRSSEDPPNVFYVIGLGNQISSSTSTKNFLGHLANDPSYPGYNSTLPAGQLFVVPDCPSSTCTAELNAAFQIIASKILLRLTY